MWEVDYPFFDNPPQDAPILEGARASVSTTLDIHSAPFPVMSEAPVSTGADDQTAPPTTEVQDDGRLAPEDILEMSAIDPSW